MVRKALAAGPAAALIALAVAIFMLVGGTDFCLDDAWIHLAYAKSLRLFVAPGYRIVRPPRAERVITARVIEISRRVRSTCKMP